MRAKFHDNQLFMEQSGQVIQISHQLMPKPSPSNPIPLTISLMYFYHSADERMKIYDMRFKQRHPPPRKYKVRIYLRVQDEVVEAMGVLLLRVGEVVPDHCVHEVDQLLLFLFAV